jgi:hypothetical protein
MNQSRFTHRPDLSSRAQYFHIPIQRKKMEIDPSTPTTPQMKLLGDDFGGTQPEKMGTSERTKNEAIRNNCAARRVPIH